MKRFDVSVVGELNADMILYGLPQTLEPEREHLAADFSLTLGSSSAIFAHNLALLGSRVGFTSCIGDDPLGKFCVGRLRESGVLVTIVTGRLYSGTQHVARAVGLTGPVACVDGSHIVDLADDRGLHHATISGRDAALLREVIERHGPASFLFADDAIVHDAGGAPYVQYVRTWSTKVDRVGSVAEHPSWEHERGLMAVVALVAAIVGVVVLASALAERLERPRKS